MPRNSLRLDTLAYWHQRAKLPADAKGGFFLRIGRDSVRIDPAAESSDTSPNGGAVTAILNAAAKVRMQLPGVGEVELDRKSVKQMGKES